MTAHKAEKPPEGGFSEVTGNPITWKQLPKREQRPGQQLPKPGQQVQQQVQEPGQPQERVRERELLPFCHKQPKQQRR